MNRKMENAWQFSNHLCQALSKSTQDYGLLFLPPRMPQVLSRSPAPMSQQWTKQPKPTYCYGGKHIMKVHETKLSAAVSSMWTLTQMTQIIVSCLTDRRLKGKRKYRCTFSPEDSTTT